MISRERLNPLRKRITEIDSQLIPLCAERMKIAREVAMVKIGENMAILDENREQEVVERALALADGELKSEISLLMRSILALSRKHQRSQMLQGASSLLLPARPSVRENVTCAFQGAPGSWSEQALIKLFPEASRLQVDLPEDVFLAVKEGRVNYGVIAIENSQTGAIGETYDLLRQYGCFIVGRTEIEIRQCLLAPQGTKPADVRRVFSHPDDFKQCGHFLRDRAWDLTACRDTAEAAKITAEANDNRTAAIGSQYVAQLHNLTVLVSDVMDSEDNRTAFVVIATAPEYDESSNLISITFSTEHRAGALCETLMPFMAQGINLRRIESRPSSGPDSYRFFAELEGNILNADMVSTLQQAMASCRYLEVIGCYKSV
ncbi:MAG: chorismate mutase [Synergistaceae bacterium]|nr:chorismate mutase [Synergistaceae bacterium]